LKHNKQKKEPIFDIYRKRVNHCEKYQYEAKSNEILTLKR